MEYLGSHEIYWYPHKSLMMAKISDGSSFRFFRMASDFRANAAAGDAALQTKDKFDSGEFRLFHVPGRTMVRPIFWNRWVYFYLSGNYLSTDAAPSTPKLVAYYWNELSLEFELKCSLDMDEEGSNSLYHKYTMVSVGDDGIIFAKYGDTAFKNYKCSSGSSSFSQQTVQINNDIGAPCDAQETTSCNWNWSAATLIQAREDPDNYVSGTYPPIFGLHDNGYIQKFTWAEGGDTLTTTVDYLTVPIDHLITVSPEHLDVGRQQLVILSPSQCGAEHDTTIILNAAAYFCNLTVANTTGCKVNTDWNCRNLVSLAPELTNTVEGRMSRGSATYWEHAVF